MAMSESAVSSRMNSLLTNFKNEKTQYSRTDVMNMSQQELIDVHTEDSSNFPITWNQRSFLDIWQVELDAEFQKGTESNINWDKSPPAGSLYFQEVYVKGHDDYESGKQMAYNIALGVCEYWDKTQVPKTPYHLDIVVAVVNDAMSHVGPLYNDILSIRRNTLTDQPWMEIHTVIMKHVRAIKWTVTEQSTSDGHTENFIETVS